MDPLSPLALGYAAFRIAYVGAGLLVVLYLWRRTRPLVALWTLVALNLAAWLAYSLPLKRLYALDEGLDRIFNVGMAACVAAGNSPWDHVQVGYASLEPLWDVLVATLALYRPERVVGVYAWLAPLAIVAMAACVFWGLRDRASTEPEWDGVLLVLAVLGLSSTSLSGNPPAQAFWAASFLLKPTHAIAMGLAAVVLGARARGVRFWTLGLLLGLLGWAFLMTWAYCVLALWTALLLTSRSERDWGRLAAATLLSLVAFSPQILNLARDYGPGGVADAAGQVWRVVYLGKILSVPDAVTLDLGILFLLGCGGTLVLRRREGPLSRILLATVLSAWALWLLQSALTQLDISPEPDELHYHLRFVMSLSAGVALAALARRLASLAGLRAGQGHVLVLGLCLPLTFPAYWDPPRMDRYFQLSREPIKPRVLEYARWIRENTAPDAVFVGGSSAYWIPALSGRRVLLTGGSRPPADYAARKGAEALLLTDTDPARLRQTAARFGVSYLAVDDVLLKEYGFARFRRPDVYQTVYRSAAITIVRLRPERRGPPLDPGASASPSGAAPPRP